MEHIKLYDLFKKLLTQKDMKELVDTLNLFLNLRANDYSAVEVNKIQFQSILINKTVKVLFINL